MVGLGRVLTVMAGAAALGVPGLAGQTRDTALVTVEGVVRGPADRPLAGVDIVVLAAGRAATTDADGAFNLRLPAGTHEVQIRKLWFELSRRTITVASGASRMRLLLDLDAFLLPYCDDPSRDARSACSVLFMGPPGEWPRRSDR